jgi:uncharacterized damage-inducible protein DinB
MSEPDLIGTVAFFRERHRIESATSLRVLKALPSGSLRFAPTSRSSSAGDIAWTIVRCLRLCVDLTNSTSATMVDGPHPEYQALIDEYQYWSSRLGERLLALQQQDWMIQRTVALRKTVIHSQSLGQLLWLFHVDAIHHRGQLSTYLRLLETNVPSIYGPSGDEHSPGL